MQEIKQAKIVTENYNIVTTVEQNYLRVYINEETFQQLSIEYLLNCLNISVNRVVIIIKHQAYFQFIQQNLVLEMLRKAPKLHSIFVIGNEQIDEFKDKNIFRIESVKEIDNILKGLEKKNSFENERLNKYGVPIVIQELLKYFKNNMHHEGLFRKCAVNSEIQQFMEEIKNYDFTRLENANPHLVACVLKQYFGQLEVPLINTESIFSKDLNAIGVINELSEINARVFFMVISFFQEVAKFEEQNKMNVKTLGMLIAPSMVKFSSQGDNPLEKINKTIMFLQKYLENFHKFVPNFHYEDLLEKEETDVGEGLDGRDLKEEWAKMNKVKQHII
ncbi:unnamed protein product (macronuclear) [Paramecium tetraurelia]|uniref:Rho-GAP domain-containing protein n=1 Tax=Paramecium tetraurelia TaxID=5888 RepID=A0DHG0_PARTE|nr:uncharacterized protein GSPATT00016864001 [Paramecium tetraurelia]CAK82477.1 unnamed protein product [Paramecium tetraurelia]|eukprot:XP_001449874.1 hypothetical protein (macronuclear) [Paramecium tetraurelia strain d4-2]